MVLKELMDRETDRYAKRFYQLLFNEGYELVGNSRYTLTKEYVTVKCPNNHIYDVTPDNFIGSKRRKGRRCSKCYGNDRLTTQEFKKRVYRLFGNEISIIGEYKNSYSTVLVKHNNSLCGNFEWDVYPANLTDKKQGCPKCGGNAREGIKGFEKKVFELEGNNYSVIGEYVNADTPIKVKHNNDSCGFFEWEVIPFNFITHGSRCPSCNESHGERLISKYFRKNNIKFIPQIKFEECKHKRSLPFDFGVYNKDNLMCLIEFQGKQHFEPTKHFGGEEQFRIRQKRDNIKRNFCKSTNIPLIEIPYWEIDNIENILNNELSNLIIKEQA